jgi:hypothetical protein
MKTVFESFNNYLFIFSKTQDTLIWFPNRLLKLYSLSFNFFLLVELLSITYTLGIM